MMKIIVDKMPSSIFDCPYAKDLDGYSKCECTWNQCRRTCRDITECPFFTDGTNKSRDLEETLKNNFKSDMKLGDLSMLELRGILAELR